jgi:hypothetical protein
MISPTLVEDHVVTLFLKWWEYRGWSEIQNEPLKSDPNFDSLYPRRPSPKTVGLHDSTKAEEVRASTTVRTQ